MLLFYPDKMKNKTRRDNANFLIYSLKLRLINKKFKCFECFSTDLKSAHFQFTYFVQKNFLQNVKCNEMIYKTIKSLLYTLILFHKQKAKKIFKINLKSFSQVGKFIYTMLNT